MFASLFCYRFITLNCNTNLFLRSLYLQQWSVFNSGQGWEREAWDGGFVEPQLNSDELCYALAPK